MKLSVRIDGLGYRIGRRLPERIRDAVHRRVRQSRDVRAEGGPRADDRIPAEESNP